MTKIAVYSRYGKCEATVPTERKAITAAVSEMVSGMVENAVVDVFMWNDNGQRESLLGIRASALGERYL
jgi:hypothetical protein